MSKDIRIQNVISESAAEPLPQCCSVFVCCGQEEQARQRGRDSAGRLQVNLSLVRAPSPDEVKRPPAPGLMCHDSVYVFADWQHRVRAGRRRQQPRAVPSAGVKALEGWEKCYTSLCAFGKSRI